MLCRNGEQIAYAQPAKVLGTGFLFFRIHLVDRQEKRLACTQQQAGKVKIGGGQFGADVHYHDDGGGLLEGHSSLTKDFRRNQLLVLGDDATRINNVEFAAAPVGFAVKAVAGDAGFVADNSPAAADDAVEKRGFAHVGAANDGKNRKRSGNVSFSGGL